MLLPIMLPNTKSFLPYFKIEINVVIISGKEVLNARNTLATNALLKPIFLIISNPVDVMPSAANHIIKGPINKYIIIKIIDMLLPGSSISSVLLEV